MYSESDRRAPARRANDEFLRRMLGGELTGGAVPTMNQPVPELPTYPQRPPCDGGEESRPMPAPPCAMTPGMPSLAMVYSPVQCWREVLEPADALRAGSQFTELLLPFVGKGTKEGGGRA